jgi:hypothetical protein
MGECVVVIALLVAAIGSRRPERTVRVATVAILCGGSIWMKDRFKRGHSTAVLRSL